MTALGFGMNYALFEKKNQAPRIPANGIMRFPQNIK